MMKKIVILMALVLLSSNANAWDLTSVANKVKSVADETSAKIENVQNKSDEKSQEAQNSIMEKIAPIESVINEAKSIENMHDLIKNNGQNFELNYEEKELAKLL